MKAVPISRLPDEFDVEGFESCRGVHGLQEMAMGCARQVLERGHERCLRA